jgi:gamma-glutamyltranspeptidase/glutathione hydrolase
MSARFGPDQWPNEELQRYQTLENTLGQTRAVVVGSKGMIAGTSGPFAVHAGLEVLKHGGSAADAVLTTALAQVALFAGATISYAGIMTAVYFDATAGKSHALNAAYNTVQNEIDPLTIPGRCEPSGRTALVPGFMAGVQAMHDRFGRVPFAALFGPAVWVAEHGVKITPVVDGWLKAQGNFVTRLPEARRVFTKQNGELCATGDLFCQPELAATLKRIASQGSAYMYEGEWARHFVDAVQREGGKMTLDDLAAYRALWTEPLETSYRDYRVISLGPPNAGGLQTLGSLKLAEAADLSKCGHYTASAEALYSLIQISRIQSLLAHAPLSTLKSCFPNVDHSPESRLTKETASRLWAHIRNRMGRDSAGEMQGASHSAGVLAVDDQGNVASIVHSINCVLWGATGIFVDGISIPDSASFQQGAIANAGPGARLTEGTNPLIVVKRGKPVLASATIGSALHQATLQNLINVLDFGMDPQTSAEQPNSRGPTLGMSLTGVPEPEYEKEAFGTGDFSEAVLEGVRARGQATKIVGENSQVGYWIGIQIDPESQKLLGGVTPKLNGLVESH